MYRINRIPNKMWLLFAILSAVFAAATAILAKIPDFINASPNFS